MDTLKFIWYWIQHTGMNLNHTEEECVNLGQSVSFSSGISVLMCRKCRRRFMVPRGYGKG